MFLSSKTPQQVQDFGIETSRDRGCNGLKMQSYWQGSICIRLHQIQMHTVPKKPLSCIPSAHPSAIPLPARRTVVLNLPSPGGMNKEAPCRESKWGWETAPALCVPC